MFRQFESRGVDTKRRARSGGPRNKELIGEELIKGNITGNSTIRGPNSLLVQGSIIGTVDEPCKVKIDGDLTVSGSMLNADIRARRVHVGASVKGCSILAAGRIEIKGDTTDVKATLSTFESHQYKLEELQSVILRAKEELIDLRQAYKQCGKQLSKRCRAPRAGINLNIGGLLRERRGCIEVDLSVVYNALKELTVRELETALTSFFSKGIIGFLAKSNREFISRGPAQEKTFLRVIGGLATLFAQARAVDRKAEEIENCGRQLDEMIDELTADESELAIAGQLNPNVTVEFLLPSARMGPNGELEIKYDSASWAIRSVKKNGEWELAKRSIHEDSLIICGAEDWRNVSLRVCENRIVMDSNHIDSSD